MCKILYCGCAGLILKTGGGSDWGNYKTSALIG